MNDETKKELAATGDDIRDLPPGWFFYLLNRLDRAESNLRNEFKKDISDLRNELKRNIVGMRDEFKQDIAGVRDELKQNNSNVRNELHRGIGELRAEIRSLRMQQFAVISGLVLTFAGVFYGLLTR